MKGDKKYMKKALLIIFILSIIFLTGCQVFNLDGWLWPDDDLEFTELIDRLDTPEKICNYMANNFEWNFSIHTYNPYQMYLANLEGWNDTGDCDDFAAFATWVAHEHGYEVYRIMVLCKYTGYYGLPLILPHVMGIFVEDDLYTYSNNQYYCPLFADSFQEIIDDFESRYYPIISYKVYDYWDNPVPKVGKWYSYVH